MKISTLALVVLAGSLALPLRAQPAPDAPAPGNAMEPAQSSADAPHNIMTWSNHKPNPVNPPADIAAPIDAFFNGLKAGDYANSYEKFLTGTRLGEQKEKMSAMISRTEDGFGIYGKMNDYEIYDNYAIGSNVLVLTYLARHEIQPLRWRFIYYRPDKNWRLINMGFDDFLLDLLN
jgi:hypothetical protein